MQVASTLVPNKSLEEPIALSPLIAELKAAIFRGRLSPPEGRTF